MSLLQRKKKQKKQQICLKNEKPAPKLTLELVPQSLWGENLRSILTPSQWDILRFEQFGKAGFKCEICGGAGTRWPVECHEIWEYDDEHFVQTLKGIIALCPMCHFAKHLGRSLESGVNYTAVKAHMMKINDWTYEQLIDYINECFSVFYQRSKHIWVQNTDWIQQRQDVLNYKPSEKDSDENFY